MTDILGDLGNILEQVAPYAATLVGGPLAGTGVSWLEGQLGLTPAAGTSMADRQAALTTALQGLPADQVAALRKSDNDLKASFVQAGLALEATDEADRASARQREVAIKDYIPGTMAVGVTVGFFGLLAFLATHEVPPASRDLLNVMLGALGTAWTAIVTYYFGSSSGNARATELLAKAGPVQQ